jgi:hypothetical protein
MENGGVLSQGIVSDSSNAVSGTSSAGTARDTPKPRITKRTRAEQDLLTGAAGIGELMLPRRVGTLPDERSAAHSRRRAVLSYLKNSLLSVMRVTSVLILGVISEKPRFPFA